MSRNLVTFIGSLVSIWLVVNQGYAQLDNVKLNEDNFSAWKELIQPTAEENAWAQIDWRPDLATAVKEASETGKPILMWAMNGHPFGCT